MIPYVSSEIWSLLVKLMAVHCQAITWTYDGLLPTEPLGVTISEIWIKIHFIQWNAFQIVSGKMAIIYSDMTVLTHWGWNKMADISQTTVSNQWVNARKMQLHW